MKKFFSTFLVFSTIISSGVFAQVTRDVDLSRANYVPLFNCEIFNFGDERGMCYDLKRDIYRSSFDDQGYAIDCYSRDVMPRKRRMCLDLADRVLSSSHVLNCEALYRDRYAQRQCEVTRRGYEEGRFRSPYIAPAPRPVVREEVIRSEVVEPSRTFVASEQYRDVCGPEAYDRNFAIWQAEKARLEDRARDRKRAGAALAVGGALVSIFGGGRTADTVGAVAMIGGATLFTLGMVDSADARFSLPHTNPVCRDYFIPEVRMVTIERETCRTTQYTERGWNYSRSYYEVRCSTKTYVTYEQDFAPWRSGRRY